MNMAMILGLVRHLLTFGGGFLVTSGWVGDSDMQAGVGALATLFGVAWSVFVKRAAPAA